MSLLSGLQQLLQNAGGAIGNDVRGLVSQGPQPHASRQPVPPVQRPLTNIPQGFPHGDWQVPAGAGQLRMNNQYMIGRGTPFTDFYGQMFPDYTSPTNGFTPPAWHVDQPQPSNIYSPGFPVMQLPNAQRPDQLQNVYSA